MVGHLVALLVLMKGQPLAYNRDNQEDKEPLFDSVDTALTSLDVLTKMVGQMVFDKDKMYDAASQGYTTATDLADYLVRKGVPFVMPMMQWDARLQRQTRADWVWPTYHWILCGSFRRRSMLMYFRC